MSGIPNTWKQVRLGDVVDILDSRRVPVNSDERAKRTGTIPYYGATGQVGTIDTHLFDEELILLGEDGAPFFDSAKNKAYLVSGKSWVNNHAHVLRAKTGILNAFVLHQLNIADFRPHVSGSTRLKLPQGTMVEIPLAVAPMGEQDRIVAALDERLSELDASVASLERAERNLVRYRAAVLAAACSGKLVPTEADLARDRGPLARLEGGRPSGPRSQGYEPADQLLARILAERRKASTKAKYEEPAQPDTSKLPKLPEGWVWATVEQLITGMTSGSRDWSRYYDRGEGTFIMAQNVRPGRLDMSFRQAVDPPKDSPDCRRSQVQPGDLLLTIVGANTGDMCVVDGPLPEHYVCQSVALLRPALVQISRWALLWFLSPEHGKKRFAELNYGAARPHLAFDDLLKCVVAIPPATEQERIVAEVDRHLSRADALAASIAQSKRRAQRLRRAILAAAFQGRLVPQDPNDEPASVLLDRIRAQAATAEAATASAPRRGRPPAQPVAPVASASPTAMTPKRRGRPPGSKNKAKA